MKVVDIGIYLLIGCLLDGNIEPENKLLEDIQIIFYRMRRVVASLKMPPEINDHIRHLHHDPL